MLAVVVLSLGTDSALRAAGVFPPLGQAMSDGLFLLATAYRFAYGAAGGWIAARLAPDRPMAHALALGALGLALGAAGAVATRDAGPAFGPRWYPVAVAAIAVPSAWAGARLRGGRDR
jgi:hypothetical protein